MSSLQSQLSGLCLDDETEDSEDKDDICMICNEWCINSNDLAVNFISCKTCAHSYHKKCIPIIYHTSDDDFNCYEMRNKRTNELLKCCSSSSPPQLLVRIIDDEFEELKYFYDANDNEIYYHPQNGEISLPNHADIFTRTKCRNIKYKGMNYKIGDSIQFKTNKGKTNTAIIKEIYLYSEANKLPDFCVFLYRRLDEIQIQRETEIETESEIYLDIESDAKICISSVLHKILVFDDIDSYLESKQCNFKEFGDVFYCRYNYNIENRRFEDINIVEIKNKLVSLSHESEQKYNKKWKQKKVKQKSIDKVILFLNYYHTNYTKGSDEYQCFDLNVPFDLKEKQNGKFEKKLPLQKGRRLVLDEIDDENNEEIKIDESDKDKMRKICDKLKITKGIHIAIKLYGFTSHLKVYKELINLVKIENENIRNGIIKNMSSSKLRDIKAKIKSKGKMGKKQEMIDGIIVKINEFRINCKANDGKSSRKRKLFDCNNNNHNRKRQKMMKIN